MGTFGHCLTRMGIPHFDETGVPCMRGAGAAPAGAAPAGVAIGGADAALSWARVFARMWRALLPHPCRSVSFGSNTARVITGPFQKAPTIGRRAFRACLPSFQQVFDQTRPLFLRLPHSSTFQIRPLYIPGFGDFLTKSSNSVFPASLPPISEMSFDPTAGKQKTCTSTRSFLCSDDILLLMQLDQLRYRFTRTRFKRLRWTTDRLAWGAHPSAVLATD